MNEVNEQKKVKAKRDIFRFEGHRLTAVNLEHVTTMAIEEKKIIFNFYSNSIFIELENEAAAKNAFEQILNVWSADVEVKS